MRRVARWDRVVVVATALLILVAVNLSIWDRERHLHEGSVLYLALAPVDPRSLMQGDYMALNFDVSNRIQQALSERRTDRKAEGTVGDHVIVRLDERRIAHFQRLASGEAPLADDEMRLRYRLRQGRVKFATDAFFFQEGHAERYESARYGRFHVDERGELLLVSLHGPDLDCLVRCRFP
ncbi:hypothetical protein HCU01_13730 [Halomonas cupida]|uniref:Uncharacterized membrane-anchored protein n=1 Tax=Halomonas cupida TaxID=44933 RepID=A0A1M7F768_9GAMM|nr:GDYXXLXY domain-containing protein [Halomonas cupida]GEN23424.1 hypothetical protein HCU01_13730 [Halomonas cupida]SHL99578.1 Uncharacterized membrane-anchored protein [Halomonas cupida]